MEKLSLKFVNKGKPFVVKNWTVEKHEKALQHMKQAMGTMSKEAQNAEFRYWVIWEALVEIDKNVNIETVRHLHPDNLIQLFDICYNAGKVDIFFHKEKKEKMN